MIKLKLLIKEVSNFPNYFVDTQGNVYSKKSGHLKKLNPWKHVRGSRLIDFKKDGKKYHKVVSHLILETFVGPRPEGKVCCHGIEGSFIDSLENLSWKTQSENCYEDKIRDGTIQRGDNNATSKVTELQVLEIRKLYLQGSTCKELSKIYGLHYKSIGRIVKRISWKHV